MWCGVNTELLIQVGGSPDEGVAVDHSVAAETGLLETRDLGAARMVFVYLARHGSAGAMNRLAQTYDPQYLATHQFNEEKNSDPTRAKRLYGAAAAMGDLLAAQRLLELE